MTGRLITEDRWSVRAFSYENAFKLSIMLQIKDWGFCSCSHKHRAAFVMLADLHVKAPGASVDMLLLLCLFSLEWCFSNWAVEDIEGSWGPALCQAGGQWRDANVSVPLRWMGQKLLSLFWNGPGHSRRTRRGYMSLLTKQQGLRWMEPKGTVRASVLWLQFAMRLDVFQSQLLSRLTAARQQPAETVVEKKKNPNHCHSEAGRVAEPQLLTGGVQQRSSRGALRDVRMRAFISSWAGSCCGSEGWLKLQQLVKWCMKSWLYLNAVVGCCGWWCCGIETQPRNWSTDARETHGHLQKSTYKLSITMLVQMFPSVTLLLRQYLFSVYISLVDFPKIYIPLDHSLLVNDTSSPPWDLLLAVWTVYYVDSFVLWTLKELQWVT